MLGQLYGLLETRINIASLGLRLRYWIGIGIWGPLGIHWKGRVSGIPLKVGFKSSRLTDAREGYSFSDQYLDQAVSFTVCITAKLQREMENKKK